MIMVGIRRCSDVCRRYMVAPVGIRRYCDVGIWWQVLEHGVVVTYMYVVDCCWQVLVYDVVVT